MVAHLRRATKTFKEYGQPRDITKKETSRFRRFIVFGPMSNIHQEVPMFYSGIDLHKDNCFINTVNEGGKGVKQERLPNVPEGIVNYFAMLGGPHKTVVESTTGWYWLSDLLDDHGIELVMAHAKYLKAISYAKVKTDKVDSHTLATLLRMNLIPRTHKISRQLRDIRDCHARLRFVQKRTSCLVRIHTIGRKFNCDNMIMISAKNIPDLLPEPYKLQLQLL